MMHVRSFCVDYWKAIAATIVWWALVASCYVIPRMWTYWYALMWAGLATVAAGIFVGGYLRYSKPSKDPLTRKRTWQSEWAWLLVQAAVVLLVVGLSFALRLINSDSAAFTWERVQQYRFTGGVFVTVFLEQLWLTWMWAARQLHSRRSLRAEGAGR